jgi:hypothetical protein
MTPYNKTERYVQYVSRLDAERISLLQEIDQLAGTKRGTPGVAKKRAQFKNRLKTITANLTKVATPGDLSAFTWPELFDLWSACWGWRWTHEELWFFKQETEYYEGRGEKSLRHRLGLPLVVSLDSCDLPNGEVKYLGANVESFRAGKVGRRMYVRGLRELPDELLTDEMLDGEVSAGKLYHSMPEAVRLKLQRDLAPEKALAHYPAMFLTTENGYGYVPRDDYSKAFSLTCITQMSPKYRLRREYVEQQLLESLSHPQQQADVAA